MLTSGAGTARLNHTRRLALESTAPLSKVQPLIESPNGFALAAGCRDCATACACYNDGLDSGQKLGKELLDNSGRLKTTLSCKPKQRKGDSDGKQNSTR